MAAKLLRVLVLTGLVLDAVVRNFATINSSYYRLIDLPEWSFGIVGAGLGLAGIAVPSLAKYLNQSLSPQANINITAMAVLVLLAALIPRLAPVGFNSRQPINAQYGFLGLYPE